MAKFNLNNFSFISLNIFVLSLLLTFCNLITSTSTDHGLIPHEFQGLACAAINCGEGTCVSSDSTFLGIDCVCNPGWKTIQFGNLTFPSCLIPNCTVNLNCSDVSTPPSVLLSACGWCGYGNCATNGNENTCQCFPGAANLFDNSSLLCLPQCSFGADCNNLGLGLPVPSPPPAPSKSGSTAVGPTRASNSSSKLGTLTIILLVAATIQTWF